MRWEESGWDQEDLDKLELSFLNRIFKLEESQGVAATVTFARYLNMVGVNPDNYPIFFRLIAMRNHWIVDAILGKTDPEEYFINIQPNFYIIRECFRGITEVKRGGIYPKSLQIYLGILRRTYSNPLEGYRVFPLDTVNCNNLGKHLNEEKDQKDPLNLDILTILDKVASLISPGKPESDEAIISVATQANNIRGKFLDMTKSLNEAIPDLLLEVEDYTKLEISPE